MRVGWLLGWAVPEEWFAPLAREALPAAEHCFIDAVPGALDRLEKSGPFDWVGGYSLGSLLLLRESARAEWLGRVALFAPILSFPREAELGGRVALGQVRQLARWLRHDAHAALTDFYLRAGLDVPSEIAPTSIDGLLWGLESLANDRREPPLPTGWQAWCGADDALLDAGRLNALAPSVQIVAGATHHPGALLHAFAREAILAAPTG